jgi:hypothetical protein
MRIRLSASAEQDLLDGFSFYELQQQGLGSYFLDSLYSDIDSLVLYGGIHAKPVGTASNNEPTISLFHLLHGCR